MKVLVLGSTGGTGQEIVKQLLEQNFEVTALARDPSKLTVKHPLLTVIKGNVLDKICLAQSVENKDVVLSALGVGKSLKSKNLISNAVNLLIPVMTDAKVSRLIFLSAIGVGETFNQSGFIQKLIFRFILSNLYADKAKAELVIKKSNLEWTLVYPVLLTNSPWTGKYKVGEHMEMKGVPKIPRADVADFMIKLIKDDSYIKKSLIMMSKE